MKPRVNFGVIGAGRIGRVHAENLIFRIPEARVLAVCDVDLERAQKCAADLNIPQGYNDHRAVLEDKDIKCIVICSSTDTHSRIIEEAALAGKDIFCEKPIDLDLGRIDRALAAVHNAGVKLQVGFNRRFDHNFRKVKDTIMAGRIGKPHILRITSRDPAPPPLEYVKVSGGIFLDMTIHDFDMARFLIGSEVEEVFSLGDVMIDPTIREIGDLDTVLVTLSFNNGAMGSIDNSRRAVYGYDQRVEVFGSEGMIAISNDTPNTACISTATCIQEDLPLFFFMERYSDSYVTEMKEFIRCVVQDLQPPVTGIDGRMPVVMGKAARLSFEEKRPVKLSEIS